MTIAGEGGSPRRHGQRPFHNRHSEGDREETLSARSEPRSPQLQFPDLLGDASGNHSRDVRGLEVACD